MHTYVREVTPEEKAKRKKRKETAELWLVKIPLILWVVLTIVIFCATDNGTMAWLLLIFGYLGIFVLPWVGICKIILRDSYK